jgi:hypothetical protein
MSKDGTWGDGICLLVSSIIYQQKIVVFADDNKQPMNVSHDQDENSSSTMFIGFVEGNHHVSLVSKPLSPISQDNTEDAKPELSADRQDTEMTEQCCARSEGFAVQTDIGWAVKKTVLSTEDRQLFIEPWKPKEQKDSILGA